MTEESERRARADAFEQIRKYCLDDDPEIASMGRLLSMVTEAHREWMDEEQNRGTQASHALNACIEAYVMLIHSVALSASAPSDLPKVEAYIHYKLIAAWERQTAAGSDGDAGLPS